MSDKSRIQGDKRIAHATHAELKSIAEIEENFLHVEIYEFDLLNNKL